MRTFDIIKNNNNIRMKIAICKNSNLNKYIDFEYFTGLCRDGCPSYGTNWTCPPNSPSFSEYSTDYEKSLIIIMYSDIKNDKLADVHQQLRKTISPVLKSLEDTSDGLMTDGGRCMYCDICTYKDNLPCRFPHVIRYSMEAMGVNLDSLSKEILNHSISWSDDQDSNNYCTVFGSVLFNGDYSEEYFEQYIRGL